MFIKICGITNLDDAELAVHLGADALGFIFAPSKRRVDVEQAASIVERLSSSVMCVGVFTQPELGAIVPTVRAAGLTAVQMHWPYEGRHIEALRAELGNDIALWQVVGFPVMVEAEDRNLQTLTRTLQAAMQEPSLDVVLLDAAQGGASGGLGQSFSWLQASRILAASHVSGSQTAEMKRPQLAVAGGLNPGNVEEAIAVLRPWAVDVVSGVESSPGRKDPDRLRRFITDAQTAGARFPPL